MTSESGHAPAVADSPVAVSELPIGDASERGSRVASAEVEGPAAEQAPLGIPALDDDLSKYERLVARLLSDGDAENHLLAVTSSVSGEGVSTVCAGLAVALARNTTRSVLLVDANLRRPALHERFGIPLGPGLRDFIAGTASQVAFGTNVPNLSLLPSGASVQHPAQLMTSETARTRIRALQTRFDYVVVDCPPVLSTVDAVSICRLADGVIVVLRSGLTPREDIERTRELLADAPLMGVILNGV